MTRGDAGIRVTQPLGPAIMPNRSAIRVLCEARRSSGVTPSKPAAAAAGSKTDQRHELYRSTLSVRQEKINTCDSLHPEELFALAARTWFTPDRAAGRRRRARRGIADHETLVNLVDPGPLVACGFENRAEPS